jgi:hypothetical protein
MTAGKHTIYYNAVPATDRKARLATLFDGPQEQGDYNVQDVIDLAKEKLAPDVQYGDPTWWANGGEVHLDFQGHENAPNVPEVAWESAGDPATPYVPDIRSPGVADGVDLASTDTDQINTNVQPQDSEPALTNADIKPNYVAPTGTDGAQENAGTMNPVTTGPAIHDAQSVDSPPAFGSSVRKAGE